MLITTSLKSVTIYFSQPFTKMADLELSTWSMSSTISVLGFLEISQIGSPAAVSRHLVLPQESGGNGGAPPVDHEEEGGEGNTPSFCVLLHGAVKVRSKIEDSHGSFPPLKARVLHNILSYKKIKWLLK